MKPSHLLAVFILGAIGVGCSGLAKTSRKESNSSSSTVNREQPLSSSTDTPNVAANHPKTNSRERINRDRIDVNPAATPLPLKFRKAAENSEVATTMNTEGDIFEVRVFKNHPQIAKVEATWVDAKEKALKIYLRNGQILEVKTDRLTDLASATASQLLEIGGLKTPSKSSDRARIANQK